MSINALALGAGLLGPDRVGYLGSEHLDFAAIGLPQQGGDFPGEIGAVVHHRQQDAAHRVREGEGQLVRLRVTQADGQAGLRVSIHQQNFLPGLGQPDA